jgi:hypothetical protein
MARYGVETRLSPEQAIDKAVAWFGEGGLGLEVTERSERCAAFAGGSGHIAITATPGDPRTNIELVTREWDYDVKQFMRKIA